jgi:hypothetical protein
MGCSTSKRINEKPPTFSEWQSNETPAYGAYKQETKNDGNFWTCDKTAALPIQFSQSGKGSSQETPAATVSKM